MAATLNQVLSVEGSGPETTTGIEKLLGLLMSDSEEQQVNLVQVHDEGSGVKATVLQVQGVPTIGVTDCGLDITIIGEELLAKVALTACLRKRDFKKADKIPRTYNQRTFTLDGRLDLASNSQVRV